MEHRWSGRKSILGNVTLDCERTGAVQAAVRDVSLGGMLVDAGSVTMPMHALVVVGLNFFSDVIGDDYRLQAMVVRHGPKGTALMFLDPDLQAINTLNRVIRTSDLESPHAA